MGKTSKMKAALIVTAVWMSCCAVLQGADREFNDIVRAISNQFRTRPLHIPFFGLINFATFAARGDCRLLVLTVESGEVTVVELKLNPEEMQAWLREPDHLGKAN
jgi:hypothetical protein